MPLKPNIPRGPLLVLAAAALGGALAMGVLLRSQAMENEHRFQQSQLLLARSLAQQVAATLEDAREAVERVPLTELPMDSREAGDLWLSSQPGVVQIPGSTSVLAIGPDGEVLASIGEATETHHEGIGLSICSSCLKSSREMVLRSLPDQHGCQLEVHLSVDALSRGLVGPVQSADTGYAWVLGPERTIVAAPDPEHIGSRPFDVTLDSRLHAMLVSMEAGQDGTATYSWEGEERLAAFAAVQVEGLELSTAVSADQSEVENLVYGTWWRIAAVLLVVLVGGGGALLVLRREESKRFRERLSLEQAAAHADRLATLGTMTAGVAHELRGPLTVLSLGLDLLEPGPDVDDMRMATDRLTDLAKDLTSFSRRRPGEPHCRPADAVAVVLRMAGAELRRVQVVDLTQDLPRVRIEAQRLEQVLLNLVLNAGHAMDGRGQVTLSGRVEGEDLVLMVQDSGPGVSAAFRGDLFQAFATTKGEGKGTGLGLFICRRIAEQAGGSLALAHSDQGALFELTLPLTPRRKEDGRPLPSPTDPRRAATTPRSRPQAPPADSDAPRRSAG